MSQHFSPSDLVYQLEVDSDARCGPALVVELPPAFDGHVGLGVAAKPFAVQLCDSQTSFHFLEDRFFGASEPVAPIGDTGSDARR